VYLTGIGPVDNPVPTGAAAPLTSLSWATLPNSATIGGWTARVRFLGLAPGFVGLAQANLEVPPGLSPGQYPIVITVGGVPSNAATLYVQ
jgi:adhesin/invasin